MRIAVCLSGLVRTYRETHENYINAIVKPNSHHRIDTFISTWPHEYSNVSTERLRRKAWYGDNAKPFPENPIDFNDIQQRYQPTMILVEEQRQFDVSWWPKGHGLNAQGFTSMLYKIYSCDRLRMMHEKLDGFRYDAVVRARFDTLFPVAIEIDRLNLDVVTVPSMMQPKLNPDYDWVNDKCAVANGSIMSLYSEWFLTFRKIVENGVPLQPETTLCQHLKHLGVSWHGWGSEMEIVRIRGH